MKLNDYVGSYSPIDGLEISEVDGNWVTGFIDGLWFQGKIYAESSMFGINNGRISKLSISKFDRWISLDEVLFNYDRGLDVGSSVENKFVQKLLKSFA